ncbi:hypothetical protein C2E23DRAFT_850535 [Lenzites betulinus]|nr:hypothetical protein C2E23DRAFT_850535 [Lenzites betulinus]
MAQLDSGILTLDDDSLHQIVVYAQRTRTIKPLSVTCHRIRLCCLPVMFRHKKFITPQPQASHWTLPPQTVWRYYRSLFFFDECRDTDERIGPPRYTDDRLLCGVFDGTYMRNAMQEMPRLSAVSFESFVDGHGLRWSVLLPILSLPQLREFTIKFMRFAPKLGRNEDLSTASMAPLTSFRYILYDYRSDRNTYPTEERALELVILQTYRTLEALTLTLGPAPLHTICGIPTWPRLRELHLRGEYPTSNDGHAISAVAMFANMPNLRVLDLTLMQPQGLHPQPLWPPDHLGVWPWPELEKLTISCPQLSDRAYEHLPSSLRTLVLRYTPHLCHYEEDKKFCRPLRHHLWQWPMVCASQMLTILRRCTLPKLHRLELEYTGDDTEEDLIRNIGVAFPFLTYLKIYRYRQKGVNQFQVQQCISRPLAGLIRLRTVALYLDLPDTPRPDPLNDYNPFDLMEFRDKTLSAVAATLARDAATSLDEIRLWIPASCDQYTWVVFDVVRGKEGGDSVGIHFRDTDINNVYTKVMLDVV